MASSQELVVYVCEQLSELEDVRFRKMFGEYMIYVNDKPVIMVCDDRVMVKMLPSLELLLAGAEIQAPYEGAKPHYVLDPDDRETLCKAAALAEQETPRPKTRKKKIQ